MKNEIKSKDALAFNSIDSKHVLLDTGWEWNGKNYIHDSTCNNRISIG